jgi:hypothetical protein
MQSTLSSSAGASIFVAAGMYDVAVHVESAQDAIALAGLTAMASLAAPIARLGVSLTCSIGGSTGNVKAGIGTL